jgi:lambda family phage portal protein
MAIIETPDAAAFQAMRGMDTSTGKPIEQLENAIIEYLRPGEKINLQGHNRPGDSFVPFTKLILSMVAVSTGVTRELLTGDYDGINYSNLRGIRNDFMKSVAPLQQRHIRQFCQPVFRAFLESAVMSGRISLPGYYTNPYPWQECTWQPPGVESIDPLREGKAHIDQISSLLRSPQEITASRGRDYEEVLNEIAEAKRMAESRGLYPADAKTALASNPSTVSPETNKKRSKRQ